MNIKNTLFTYLSFLSLLITNETLKTKYNFILTKVLTLPEKQNKKNILAYLFTLYNELTLFLTENKTLFSRKEKGYLKALKNLLMQLRRYLKIQDAKTFSNSFNTLSKEEFKLGLEELSKSKKITKDIFLLSKPYLFDFKISQPTKKGKNPFKNKNIK